jgi:16S rRNA (guanine966-N2)-methyltransferase
MRIIAGQRRGHKLEGPKGKATRPTSDLVRESLFNILGESVEGLTAIDLFAGTGALGLEALSRGAARAIFVEQNRDNASLIRRNIATLRYEDRAQVVTTDAFRWARAYARSTDADPVVVFLDPPYREFEAGARRVNQLIARLVDQLPAESLIAVEAGRPLDANVLPDADQWDVRRYGGTQIAIRTVPARPRPEPAAEHTDAPEEADDAAR